MLHVQLPVRNEITLFEAVTAFVYGKPSDPSSDHPTYISDALLARLYRAARAGQVGFRALKIGKPKYQEIKPSYFRKRCRFNWPKNEIEHWVPYNNPEDPEYDRTLAAEWYDVHLNREQFALLLREMGVSVQESTASLPQSDDADVPSKRKTYETGDPGRLTSRHLYLPEAKRRLDAENHPETIKEFSEQLAQWLEIAEPEAAPAKAGTIRNRVRPLWRAHEKVCTK